MIEAQRRVKENHPPVPGCKPKGPGATCRPRGSHGYSAELTFQLNTKDYWTRQYSELRLVTGAAEACGGSWVGARLPGRSRGAAAFRVGRGRAVISQLSPPVCKSGQAPHGTTVLGSLDEGQPRRSRPPPAPHVQRGRSMANTPGQPATSEPDVPRTRDRSTRTGLGCKRQHCAGVCGGAGCAAGVERAHALGGRGVGGWVLGGFWKESTCAPWP